MELRPDFKVIIMSATIDPNIFTDYFYKYKNVLINLSGSPNYPIESIFLK